METIQPAAQRHKPKIAPRPSLPKLSGWLLVLAVGVVLFPVRILLFLVQDLAPAFTGEAWALLTTAGSPAFDPLNGPLLIFELVGNVVLLGSSTMAAVLFFRRRRRFPLAAIVLLIGAMLFYLADDLLARQILAVASQADAGSNLDLYGAGIVCAVVIPYLLRSDRVKATFVR